MNKRFFIYLVFISLLAVIAPITVAFYYLPKLSQAVINVESTPKSAPAKSLSIAGGIVPHHLAAKPIIDQFWQKIGEQKPDTIILISPDHFKKGELSETPKIITVGLAESKFGDLIIAQDLLAKLDPKIFVFNSADLDLDHGIMAHLDFIKKYLPEVKILPFLVPADINQTQIADFTKQLAQHADSKVVVIASVDFSHYLPRQAADLHDAKSLAAIVNFDEPQFPKLEVDCWQCLYSSCLYAQLEKKDKPEVLEHKNSLDFLAPLDLNKTTSYFTIIFKQSNLSIKKIGAKTILFVGDMMLDRNVEALMNKNSFNYPFEKIGQFFKGLDLVFANLEGPIVKNPTQFPAHSLQFAFSPKVTTALNFNGINLVSLANNHILNMGSDGLNQTREFLKDSKINFAGDPNSCDKKFAYQNDYLVMLAFNKTNSACTSEDIIKTITEIKAENKIKFLAVSIHWGNEYQTNNTDFQQKAGRQMIEAGADVIIGHHPHVVENIEVYKNKLIFYSLGNFIFDQYFSVDTQQGLMVGYDGSNYYLIPIQGNRSALSFMNNDKSKEFLRELAKRSVPELTNMIEGGKIELIDN